MAGPLFDLVDVSVAYDEHVVLHGITLRVEPGERVAVIGRSGAGKSTLLRKLHALCPDESALVHQDLALVPPLSVFHNVYAGRLDRSSAWRNIRNLVRPETETAEEVREILSGLGLSDKLDEPIAELSGGEQQRVAVARAIYREPGVILADEPVSSVDPHLSDRVLEILVASANTLVVSLHDVERALAHFPRIVGLKSGRIAFDLPSDGVTGTMLASLYAPC